MKLSRIITFANNKGGVGKTTTVSAVGSILARRGYDVLVVDLDGSANLTRCFTKQVPSLTLYESLTSEQSLPVINITEHLDLVPASKNLYGIELALSQEVSRESIFSEKLEEVKSNYDFILLDCPPHIGLLLISAFTASQDVIIVLEPEVLPIEGLVMLRKYIEMVQRRLNHDVSLTGILITLYQKIKLHKTCVNMLENAFGDVLFNTKIRKNCSLSEAILEHKSIKDYAPTSNGAVDYEAFTEELLERLKNQTNK